jgi:hypothetical protein
MRIYLLSILFVLQFASCSNSSQNSSNSDCKYGSPTAIFSDTLQQISQHQFSTNNNESTESIVFEDGIELQILQSGCNNIKQEFQFKYQGNFQDRNLQQWTEEALKQFIRLSQLHPDYMVFQLWGQAIAAKAEEIKRAERIELESGFYFKLDWIAGSNDANLMLTLSENE